MGRIALVNPDKSRAIEDHILNLARTGRLGGEVSEKQIIQILEQMEKESETKVIVFLFYFISYFRLNIRMMKMKMKIFMMFR